MKQNLLFSILAKKLVINMKKMFSNDISGFEMVKKWT